MNRYAGKPFLRLLDSYVLDAIGQLNEEQSKALREIEPKLASLYGKTGSWQEIVRLEMNLPLSFPDSIRRIWDSFLKSARSQGVTVSPEEFVERFVDENFPETRLA
ncbi:hypothetical protein [Aquabacterium humicola]|uniref:hypothetical protein n=1 Tax=Aquabacterium humicola TaxID=3237377 RepID=UPI00254382C4|nr:hypothetical protein [Rubrivivax pictus]